MKKTERPRPASKTELRRGRIKPGEPEEPLPQKPEETHDAEQLLFGELRTEEQRR